MSMLLFCDVCIVYAHTHLLENERIVEGREVEVDRNVDWATSRTRVRIKT